MGLPVFSDSEEGIISGLFGFKVSWGLVVKTGMESGAVVEGFDVMEDGATRFGRDSDFLQGLRSQRKPVHAILHGTDRPCSETDRLSIPLAQCPCSLESSVPHRLTWRYCKRRSALLLNFPAALK